MGEIYRAHHPQAGRAVAIKRVARLFARQPGFVAAFEREARAAALLQHPHIIPIFDVSRDEEDLPYLVMPFMAGGNLARLLAEQPNGLPLDRALCINLEIAGAIDYLHTRGIVHRDLKPGNILLDADGHAYITDFGVARLAGQLEKPGVSAPGTPEYQAPELLIGQPASPASDRWGLAAVCFELLSGRPYMAYGEVGVLAALRPDLPPDALLALARTLSEQPEERPESAMAFAIALNEACGIRQPCENRPVLDLFDQPGAPAAPPALPPTRSDPPTPPPGGIDWPAPQPLSLDSIPSTPPEIPQPWSPRSLRRRSDPPPDETSAAIAPDSESRRMTPPWGSTAPAPVRPSGLPAPRRDQSEPPTPPWNPTFSPAPPPVAGPPPDDASLEDRFSPTPPWIPDPLTELPARDRALREPDAAPPAGPAHPPDMPDGSSRSAAAREQPQATATAPPRESRKAPGAVAAPAAPTREHQQAPRLPVASLGQTRLHQRTASAQANPAPTLSRFRRSRRSLLPGEQLTLRVAISFLALLALLLFLAVMSSIPTG